MSGDTIDIGPYLGRAINMAITEAWYGKYPEATEADTSALREAIVAKVRKAMTP